MRTEMKCYHCEQEIEDNNFLGNEKIGYIHIACLAKHIEKLKL